MARFCLIAVALTLLLANLCECKRKHVEIWNPEEQLPTPGSKMHVFHKEIVPEKGSAAYKEQLKLRTLSKLSRLSKDIGRNIYMSKWSECKMLPNQDKDVSGSSDNWHNMAMRPILGVQTRKVNCRNLTAEVLDDRECGKQIEPSHSHINLQSNRTCIVKLDCIVGEWMMWLDQPDGSRVRYREIVRMPQGGGADCGVVQEVEPAVMEPSAHWVAGPWGTCNVTLDQSTTKTEDPDDQVDDDIYEDDDDDDAAASEYQEAKNSTVARCGGGIQARQVTCVRVDGKKLSDAQCAHVSMPTLVQPCEVPCPRDCEVGDWSEWTPCQPTDGCPLFPVQQLTTTGYSVRHRRVKSATSGGGAPCPPLEEKRTCAAPKCASWKALPWGPCVLNAPHTVCGPGKRTRELMCLGNDGKEAQRAWCAGAAAPARNERCRIACSGDCVVSGWGAWGECSAPCSAPAAPPPHRTRTRHVLAHASPSGWPCPLEDQLVQHETCNTHACATYSWLSTSWGPCEPRAEDFVPASNYTDFLDGDTMSDFEEEEPCIEEGEMTRDVMCIQNNADAVREALCTPLKRPVSRRACTVRCRRIPENKACKVEPWEAWSKCSNSCDRTQQSRKRVVHGGPNCGALIESRDCPIPSACKDFKPKWTTTDWKECVLPEGIRCGFGMSVRYLECILGTTRVELARCAGQVVPHLTQQCYKECSPRSEQKVTCKAACKNPLSLVYRTEPKVFSNCTCPSVSLELSPADSDCILPPGAECGEGRTYRAAKCLYKDSDKIEEVPMEVCEQFHMLEGPYRVRAASSDGLSYGAGALGGLVHGACSVRCARDCALGPWGGWGPCATEDNSLAAYMYRSREVIDEGTAGGRECGPTLQRLSCAMATPRWVTSEWSLCVPERGQCGSAVVNRTVTCEDGAGNQLPASSCSGAGAAPAQEAACHAPCPRDCVVSPWSDWSPCQMTKWGGRRDRTRAVLRGAARGGGACPALVEAEPCAPLHHAWHAAPYDDCTPLGDSPCGEGIKRRTVRCLRSDGVFVNDSFCPNTTNMEPRESWCYVPCGVDCALGPWSEWDSSACHCGEHAAHMRRTRQRLSPAVWPGRPCPVVEQRVPCPRTMCMKLISSKPPSCQQKSVPTEMGYCGWLVYESNVGCQLVTNEGLPVFPYSPNLLEPFFCTTASPGRFTFALPPKEEYYCTRRCGCHEKDVGTQGPWGPWGPCKDGTRSRTREMITQPRYNCNIPEELLTFEWSICPDYEYEDDEQEEENVDKHGENQKGIHSWNDPDTDDYGHDDFTEATTATTSTEDPYHFKRKRPSTKHHSTPPRIQPELDERQEGSSSVITVVWAALLILGLNGVFLLYRAIFACLRSRQLKKITKV